VTPAVLRNTNSDDFQNPILDDNEDYSPSNSYPEGALSILDTDDLYQESLQKISDLESKDLLQNEKWALGKLYKTRQLLELLTFSLDASPGSTNPASKYFNYGCYCSELERFPGMQGNGQAVDPIDLTCQMASKCRHCAEIDHNERCHSYRSYSFTVDHDAKTMTCTNDGSDPASVCRKNLCLCDKDFVELIVAQQNEYDMTNSLTWGDFERYGENGRCGEAACPEEGCKKPDACCGNYPNRIPFISERRSCCDGRLKDQC